MVSKYSWLNWKKGQDVPPCPKEKPKDYAGEPSNDMEKAVYPILKDMRRLCSPDYHETTRGVKFECWVHGAPTLEIDHTFITGLTNNFLTYWYNIIRARQDEDRENLARYASIKAIEKYKSFNGLSHLS